MDSSGTDSGTDTGIDTGAPTEPLPGVDLGRQRAGGAAGQETATSPSASGSASVLRRGRAWIVAARHSRRRVALLVLVLLIVVGTILATTGPFTSPTTPIASRSYATTTIKRENLSSQTQVTATLGYADTYTVTAPTGTSTQNLMQDQQAVTSAQAKVQMDESATTAASDAAMVSSDQAALASDRTSILSAQAALETDRSTLDADQAKEVNDCAGTGSTGQSCANDEQKVSSDQQKVSSDQQAVAQDQAKMAQDQAKLSQDQAKQSHDASQAHGTLAADEQTLAQDQAALAADEEQATIRSAAFSELPAVGQVVTQGQTLYVVGTTPVVLLYGTTPATRNLYQGEAGPDVAQLNSDLRALGYTSAPSGDSFTAGTAAAVDAFQAHIGVPRTGNLALGQIVFLPSAARVTSVSGVLGADPQPGSAVLTATSTTKQVSIALDANLQSDVKVGDPVTITLPNLQTTPGVVSYVGTVATVPTNSGNTHGTQSSTPTITVDVTPSDPSAIGKLDQAPVTVSITNASARNVLVVPVNALLALQGGGYALEVVPAHGPHYLIPVKTGLFDDADGLVQVTGSRVREGTRVVVPST